MQPLASFASSQVLPAAVGSLSWTVLASAVLPLFQGITNIAGREGTALESKERVGTNGGQSLGDGQLDISIARGLGRGRVLVLGDAGDLGVDGGLGAEHAGQADLARVALEGAEDDGLGLAVNVASGLGVGEGLVGNNLLEAVQVLDVGGTRGGGCVTQEGKDGVGDVEGVVQLQGRIDDAEGGFVRVLLGNLTLGGAARVQGDLAGRSNAHQGSERSFVLHDVVDFVEIDEMV